MDFDSIRIFLRVAERGSFTAAARQLGLPLTSVSRRVKMLEEDLGLQLLYRTTRRVWVTEAGRDYYERCLEAEGILEQAESAAKALRSEPEGTLRVLVPYTLGLLMLEPRLAEFRRRNPRVQLVLTYDNYPLDPIQHGFDVALRIGPLPDSAYVAHHLGWSRARLVASPAYLERRGRPATPQDLSGHSLLLMGSTAPLVTLSLRNEAGQVADVTIKPILITNESATIIRQASNDEGIALISTQLTLPRLQRGELEIVLPRWHRADDVELNVIFPRRATLDRKVRAFVDFAADVFSTWVIEPDLAPV